MRGQAMVEEIASLTGQVELYERVAGVLNSIGEERQMTAQHQIEGLVTRGLQTIFGEEMSFHLVASVSGKRPQIDFLVRSTLGDGRVVDTPVMEARGGGVAATVGFLLRLVVMLLSKPQQDSMLFLDECFAMVSAEYEPRLAEFLREIVDKTGVQLILVTHSTAYSDMADKLYNFSLVDGVTQVREGAVG